MRAASLVLSISCSLLLFGTISTGAALSDDSAAPLVVYPDGSGEYATIADAVAAANPGDTILLGPGEWLERGVAIPKELSIVALDAADSPLFVEAPDLLFDVEGVTLTIDGVSIEGGSLARASAGAAVDAYRVRAWGANVISFRGDAARATFVECDVEDGGEIRLKDEVSLKFIDSSFIRLGPIRNDGSILTRVHGERSTFLSSGVWETAVETNGISVDGCRFETTGTCFRVSSDDLGGVSIENTSFVDVETITWGGRSASLRGSYLERVERAFRSDGPLEVTNCTLVDIGIVKNMWDCHPAVFTNCLVIGGSGPLSNTDTPGRCGTTLTQCTVVGRDGFLFDYAFGGEGVSLTLERTIVAHQEGAITECDRTFHAICSNLFEVDDLTCAPGTGFVSLDPMFCSPETGGYGLMDSSPCTEENSPCGAIGALGPLCAPDPAGLPPVAEGGPMLTAFPNPLRDRVQLDLGGLTVDSVRLLDVTGRVAQQWDAAIVGDDVDLRIDRALRSGMYFIEARNAGRPIARTRVVVVR